MKKGWPASVRYGVLVRRNSCRHIAQCPIAVAALLEQPAIGRVKRLEPGEGGERMRDATQIPLAHRDHVENVPILGHLEEQHVGGPESLGELAVFEQLTYSPDFSLDG
jgi:hypothetical protein